MNYCIKCGNSVSNHAKYCGKCGEPMRASVHGGGKGYFELYIETLKKYFDFGSRASRKEYWNFFILTLIIEFILGMFEGILGIASDSDESVLAGLYYLIVMIPTIAVGVRRMHDLGKSGWNLIIPIYNFILLLSRGDDHPNNYGSSPTD